MSNNLRLEEIVTIVKGVSEWKREKKDYDTFYKGAYTPNGSDKSIVVSATISVRTKRNEFLPDRRILIYHASLKLGETELTSLTSGQAKRVYQAVRKAYLQREDEKVEAVRRKADEEKAAAVLQVKEALKGDSTLCTLAKESRPFYRRFLG